MIERAGWSPLLQRLPALFSHAYTLFVVTIAWLFFRIESIDDIVFYLEKLFFINRQSSHAFFPFFFMRLPVALAILFGIFFAFPVHQFPSFMRLWNRTWIRECVLILLFVLSVFVLTASTYNPFIYFRF
jgi:alginate O-acetyltransferase complex protein AlgI